jgi:hypothetical protein
MAVEVVIPGMTVANPIAVVPPAITGLIAWAYFGNLFASDNTNLVAGGSTFANVGTGPVSINNNFCRMWYNAAISSGWRRFNDAASAPCTFVAVGKSSSATTSSNVMMGDSTMRLDMAQAIVANGSQPSLMSARGGRTTLYQTVPSATAFRAAAITEPQGGVTGIATLIDITAGVTVSSPSEGGLPSVTGNATMFGTQPSSGAGSVQMDVAFAAIITGVQMTLAQIQAQIMPAARSMLTQRGITGV